VEVLWFSSTNLGSSTQEAHNMFCAFKKNNFARRMKVWILARVVNQLLYEGEQKN
jgi:hypothetical protein